MSPWTESAVADLRRMLVDERMSRGNTASQLSRNHGERFTRNMVVGKAQRLGIKNGNRPSYNDGKSVRSKSHTTVNANSANAARRRAHQTPEQGTEVVNLPLDQSPDAVSLFDVKRGQCRWPLNEISPISDFRFCGSPVHDRSLCRRHFRLCYHKPPRVSADERFLRRLRYIKNSRAA